MSLPERRHNFQRTAREARVAAIAWILSLLWTVGVSWWLSRETPPPLIYGIPRWVVLGVFLPWLLTAAFNIWYSAVYLAEREPAKES